jgi:hypothetical protein
MGVGGIFLAFGFTIVLIAIFTRMSSWRDKFPFEMTVATGFLVVGGVMFVLGWLLSRTGRRSERAAV